MRIIKKEICREELKSRIPGFFAYLEENDNGEFVLHKATDSPIGCYGKVIEAINMPVSLVIDGNMLLESGKTYSYRTVMNYYHRYKDELDDENDFKSFILKGIGKIEINLDELGLKEKENDLVPSVIYIATVRNILKDYNKYRIIYENYANDDDSFDINLLDEELCCACKTYRRMGGNKMYEKLVEWKNEAEKIADEYYGYADNGKSCICLNVNLTQSVCDLGYLSCYLNEWVGGNKHYKGELYTYDGNTYICIVDNNDTYDEDTMQFVFDSRYFKLLTEYVDNDADVEKRVITEYISSANPNGKKFRLEDGTDSFTLEGSADSKLKSLRGYKQYIGNTGEYEEPSKGEDWLFYYKVGLVTSYTTINDDLGNICSYNGLLSGIKTPATDINDLAAFGNVITSIEADKDEHTITFTYYLNVHLKANDKSSPSIKRETDDDGNVLYKFRGFVADIENDKYHGVKYVETYPYDTDGELADLIEKGLTIKTNSSTNKISDGFKYYIDVENYDKFLDYGKYAFSTSNSRVQYEKQLDTQIVSISYNNAYFTSNVKNDVDYMYATTFKTDYLDGITYKPNVENNVYINRGNYAAFERHLKLSEVKTMEDFENYSNGSFFNIQSSS